MSKFFINILIEYSLGFLLFFSLAFAQEAPQPDADFKAVVVRVGDTLKIVENFSTEQLSSCSLTYETPGKIYFFQDRQSFDQFRACHNLREVACEKKQKDTVALNQIAQANERKYHEIEAEVSGYSEKMKNRLAAITPSNPLLRVDPQEALDAHSSFLNQHGRAAMAEFFKTHYTHRNSTVLEDYEDDLYRVHANALDQLQSLELITWDQRFELADLIKEELSDEKLHEGLTKVYEVLFTNLPEEDLKAYVKNFVTAQYSKFKTDLYYALPKNPTFVERVTTELFPQEKRQRVEAILRDIKGLSQKFLTEVPQKSPLKKEGLKKIQDIQVDWPSQSSGIMTKLGLLGSVTQENASYLGEGGYNEMQVNGLSLHAPYWRMFGQLAHEVGHSIQPHEEAWRSFWKKFVDCIQQPGLDFQVHHIEEIFADWFSTELLMRQIQGLSQEEMRGAVLESVGFCEPSSQYVARVRKELTFEMMPNPHPDSDSRVNKILRAHPFFNKLFGCPSSPAYCAP